MSLILDGNGPITGATTIGSPTATTLTATTVTFGNGSSQIQAAGLGTNNQTWQNLTASRAINTTYTNSTGYPIMVSVSTTQGTNTTSTTAYVGAVVVAYWVFNSNYSGSMASNLSFIVPNGATYQVVGGNISNWSELR